jgi:hypothetical protein
MARADDGPISVTLLDGLQAVSQNETIPFTQYQRYVLPLDGYVFWLRVSTTEIRGSLHISADRQQNEDETAAVTRVVFTTGTPVQAFQAIDPNQIWVGETAGIRFAFSRSGPKYRAADLFHYAGTAVLPALESQLVDVGAQLSPDSVVVSNSLPAWLRLKDYSPIWLNAPNPGLMLYPSFAVPDNLRPPYGVVHILPSETRALQAFPALGHDTTSQWQLAADRVRVTLYGLTNDDALDFLNLVLQFSEDTNDVGMMAPPIIRDEKRIQPELGILAMKKTIEWEVSYFQGRVRNIARALIASASASVNSQSFGVA